MVSKVIINKNNTVLKGGSAMCKVYGYVRVSTTQQKTQRQIDNIKAFDNNAIIKEEKQSGKDIDGRAVFKDLLARVASGDTIIFDEVSRMSRNANEGFELYMNLMSQNINLVFLKEPHINTDEYKRRTQKHFDKVTTDCKKMDKFVNGILELVSELEKDNLKDNIRLAFEQAEHERKFLIKRVTEGKAKSDKHQGRPQGSANIKSDKADHIKKVIMEQSKDFDGKFSDAKIMREYLQGVARNTYYKYKAKLKAEQ